MPPESTRQQAMLLVWPRAQGDWGADLDQARDTIAAMAAALGRDQSVILASADAECTRSIAEHPRLANARSLSVYAVDNNDIWARDSGPITVFEHGERCYLDFRFDGWGGRFAATDDDRLTAALFAAGALVPGELERYETTLEAGSIEVNGAGALLTTDRCLLTAGRNPGLDRAGAEYLLRDSLGVDTVHWLSAGELIGDDTDGHVDTLARFAGPDTIVFQGCSDSRDAHYAPLRTMAQQLAALRDFRGQAYRLIELPLPEPQYDPIDGHRLPAGYANFLIGNGCVLVPAFDDPADTAAQSILAGLFDARETVPIDARALIRQHGSLHCAAMQIPALSSAA